MFLTQEIGLLSTDLSHMASRPVTLYIGSAPMIHRGNPSGSVSLYPSQSRKSRPSRHGKVPRVERFGLCLKRPRVMMLRPLTPTKGPFQIEQSLIKELSQGRIPSSGGLSCDRLLDIYVKLSSK